jgi:hypothetical protein
MKRAARLVLLVAATSFHAFATSGCALEEDVGPREAASPVGYTPPSELSAGPTGQAAPPASAAPAAPPPATAYGRDAVVVGEDESSADGPAPGSPADEYSDTDPAALTDFRSALDPYGSWRDDPTYGTVWVPSPTVVGDSFTPYVSAGHWEYDSDYVWASDYDWGWAPFHYGRWVYGGDAWEWIPGRVYSGAWVSWRYGIDDWAYVGWAPLAPLWGWRGGVAVGMGFVPYASYGFVPSANLFSPSVGTHLVMGTAVGAIAAHTQPWTSPSTGRVAAHPAVSGPPPSTLHIQSASVVRATASTAGVAQARAFARPSSAMALGARAPQGFTSSSARASVNSVSRAPYAGAGSRASYSLGQTSSAHFGGKLGSGFAGSAASAPAARSTQAYAVAERPYSGPSSAGYRSSAPSYHGAGPSYHSIGAPPSGPPAAPAGAHGGGGGGFSGGSHGGGGHSGGGGHGGGGGHR